MHTSFSPDKNYLAVANDSPVLQLWNLNDNHLTNITATLPVRRVFFSGNSRYIVVNTGEDPNSFGDTLCVWKIPTKEHDLSPDQALFRATERSMLFSAISSDGAYVAMSSRQHTTIGNLVTNQTRTLPSEDNVTSLSFSPEGKFLLIGRTRPSAASANSKLDEALIQIWDLSEWSETAQIPTRNRVVNIKFSPDAKYAALNEDMLISVRSEDIHTEIFHKDEPNQVSFTAFSQKGTFLGIGTSNPPIRILHLPDGRDVAQARHNGAATIIVFNPDESAFLTSAVGDNVVHIWDIDTNAEVARIAHDRPILSAVFMPDGRHVATATAAERTNNGVLRLWELPSAGVKDVIRYSERVEGIHVSSTGTYVALLADEGRGNNHAYVYNTQSSELVFSETFDSPATDPISYSKILVNAVSVTEDGKYVAATANWGHGHTAFVWNTGTRQAVRIDRLQGISAVSLTSDGQRVAIVTSGRGELLRIENGQVTSERSFRADDMVSNTEGSQLGIITHSNGNSSVELYQIKSAKAINLVDMQGEIKSIKFSPDGKLVAVIGSHGNVQVWSIHDAQELVSLSQDQEVTNVAVDPRSQVVATAAPNGLVRIWKLSGQAQVTEIRHDGYLAALGFSKNGEFLLTANGYIVRQPFERPPNSVNAVKSWIWRPADLVNEACNRVGRNLETMEWQRYMGSTPPQETCSPGLFSAELSG